MAVLNITKDQFEQEVIHSELPVFIAYLKEKYEDLGVTADLCTYGKIIGGGLPVGAYGGKEDIMRMVAPSGKVYQAGTLSGNPLAMAAGIAQLSILKKKGFYDELNKKADTFFEELADIIKPYKEWGSNQCPNSKKYSG